MRRILLTVAYEGTAYCGWQLQPTELTIEEVLNRELSKLLHEDIAVRGTSRTDSGVHAMGNLCVFDTSSRIPADKLCHAINRFLPEDIVVTDSREVAPDFHPRKCDSIKTYEYRIYNSKLPNPLRRRYTTFFYMRLDVTRMREAAAYLVGEHDFRSFCSVRTQVESTVRRILSIDISTEGAEIIIRIRGTGFLYNMVRIIVGTLLRVGTGLYEPAYVKEILQARDRQKAGQTAPACGLCLVSIELYPEGFPAWVLDL